VGTGTGKVFTENELHLAVFNDTAKLLGFGLPTVRIPALVCLADPDDGWAEALGHLVLQALHEQKPLEPLYYRRGAYAKWYTYHEALLSQIRAQLPIGATPTQLYTAAERRRRDAAAASEAGNNADARITRA
jgi:hypothetical protein